MVIGLSNSAIGGIAKTIIPYLEYDKKAISQINSTRHIVIRSTIVSRFIVRVF